MSSLSFKNEKDCVVGHGIPILAFKNSVMLEKFLVLSVSQILIL